MNEYMKGKKGYGNYQPSFMHAHDLITGRGPYETASLCSCGYDADTGLFTLPSLSETLTVSYPECEVLFSGTDTAPVADWRLVVLHYLGTASGVMPSGELAHFRQMPGGRAYESAFDNRSVSILEKTICPLPIDTVKGICLSLGGKVKDSGSADVQAEFLFAPLLTITLQVWLTGEDDIAGGGGVSILFDKRASYIVPTEDMAVAASLLARFIMKECGSARP